MQKKNEEERLRTATTSLLALALAGIASAQGTILYAPVKVIKDQNISVKGWGSGTISETDETAYEGGRAGGGAGRGGGRGGGGAGGAPGGRARGGDGGAGRRRRT